MRILTLALLIPLTACAAGKDWPSLARRPGESAPLPTIGVPDAPDAVTMSDSASPVIAGRIAEAAKDLSAVTKRWQRQQTATAAAVAAARGAPDASEVAGKAQLEISRLERIGAQIGDLRARLDAIGGDLALAAADGHDPKGAFRDVGGLIGKVEALRKEHLAAAADLRGK